MPTILIVDDEKPMREFLVQAFEDDGYQVLEATHGQHALSVLANAADRPDLIVSDVMMPLLSGIELCQIVKADPALNGIPVVLMSAAHPRASSTAGADAILAKPFDLNVLDSLVRRLLADRKPALPLP